MMMMMTSRAFLYIIFLFHNLYSCHFFVSNSNYVQKPPLTTPRLPGIAAFNNTNGRPVDSDDNNARTGDIDEGRILTDLVGVFLACQIIGLLDVLNDPSFYDRGGWLQPIPSVPSSLPTLVQHISFYSSLFVSSSAVLGYYDQNSSVITSQAEIKTAITFTFVVVLGTVIFAASPMGESAENFQSAYDFVGALRDCYVIVLVTWAGRFLYRSLFR